MPWTEAPFCSKSFLNTAFYNEFASFRIILMLLLFVLIKIFVTFFIWLRIKKVDLNVRKPPEKGHNMRRGQLSQMTMTSEMGLYWEEVFREQNERMILTPGETGIYGRTDRTVCDRIELFVILCSGLCSVPGCTQCTWDIKLVERRLQWKESKSLYTFFETVLTKIEAIISQHTEQNQDWIIGPEI